MLASCSEAVRLQVSKNTLLAYKERLKGALQPDCVSEARRDRYSERGSEHAFSDSNLRFYFRPQPHLSNLNVFVQSPVGSHLATALPMRAERP
jgi:hypothetical protein